MSTLATLATITIRVPDNGLDGIVERSVKLSEIVKLVRTAHQRSWRGVVETRDARLQLGWVLNQAKARLSIAEFGSLKRQLHIDPRSVERSMAIARACAHTHTGRMDMHKVGELLVTRGLASWADSRASATNRPPHDVTDTKAARGPLVDGRKPLARKLVAKVGAKLGGESLRRFEDYFDGHDRVSYRMLRELCAEPRSADAQPLDDARSSVAGDRRSDAGGHGHARPGDARLHDHSLQAAVQTQGAGAWRDRPIPAEGLRAAVGARGQPTQGQAERSEALDRTGSAVQRAGTTSAELPATGPMRRMTAGPGRIADAAGQMTFADLLTQTRCSLDRLASSLARLDDAALAQVRDVLQRARGEIDRVLGSSAHASPFSRAGTA